MPNKGIDLDALTNLHNDVIVVYRGGVFAGHVSTVQSTMGQDALGPEKMEFTIQTFNVLALDLRRPTYNIAIGALRALLKKAREHEDKESENLISGALVLLEL